MLAEPPAAPAPAAVQAVVVQRRDASEVVASLNTPLTLAKGARREAALLQRVVFVTASLAWTRAASAPTGPADRYRWTYKAFLQRQLCVTAITGQFACAEPEVEALPDKAEGDAPVSANVDEAPEAEAARAQLTAALKGRADAIFEADRRAHFDPLLKAAGVAVLKASPPR